MAGAALKRLMAEYKRKISHTYIQLDLLKMGFALEIRGRSMQGCCDNELFAPFKNMYSSKDGFTYSGYVSCIFSIILRWDTSRPIYLGF